mgnify:CR=1 FL=1
MKDIIKHHHNQIKKQNKKYPMMEYFLDQKPLSECSEECQRQVKELKQHTR